MRNLPPRKTNFRSKTEDFLKKIEAGEPRATTIFGDTVSLLDKYRNTKQVKYKKYKENSFLKKTKALKPTPRIPFHDNILLKKPSDTLRHKYNMCNVGSLKNYENCNKPTVHDIDNLTSERKVSANITSPNYSEMCSLSVNVERVPSAVLNKYFDKCKVVLDKLTCNTSNDYDYEQSGLTTSKSLSRNIHKLNIEPNNDNNEDVINVALNSSHTSNGSRKHILRKCLLKNSDNDKNKISSSESEINTALKHCERSSLVVDIERLPSTILTYFNKSNVGTMDNMCCNISKSNKFKQPHLYTREPSSTNVHKLNIEANDTDKDVINVSLNTSQTVNENRRLVLRERKQDINYTKFFRRSTVLSENSKNHTPVYKKRKSRKKKTKENSDIYEFDSDSDKNAQQKRNTLDTSIPFEKHMKSMMYEIEAQNKMQLKKKARKLKKKDEMKHNEWEYFNAPKSVTTNQKFKNIRKKGKKLNLSTRQEVIEDGFEDKLNDDLNTALSYVSEETGYVNSNKDFVNNMPRSGKLKILQNVMLNETGGSPASFKDKGTVGGFAKNNAEPNARTKTMSKEQSTKINLLGNKEMEVSVDTNNEYSSNLADAHESECNDGNADSFSTMSDDIANVNIHADESRSVTINANVTTSNESQSVTTNRHNESQSITTVVDAIEDSSNNEYASEFLDFDKKPNVNSTSTPWRFNMGIKRNPFFLQYKKTSLPTYNQEMVIDSSVADKISSGNKTSNSFCDQSTKTKQDSIFSYISAKSVPASPAILERSLFDIHELSPIKRISDSTETFCTNSSTRQGVEKVKRQISDAKDNARSTIVGRVTRSSKSSPIRKKTDEIERQILDEKVDDLQGMVWDVKKTMGTRVLRFSKNSPIKKQTDDAEQSILAENTLFEKETRQSKNPPVAKGVNMVKRRILGEKVENLINITNNTKRTPEQNRESDADYTTDSQSMNTDVDLSRNEFHEELKENYDPKQGKLSNTYNIDNCFGFENVFDDLSKNKCQEKSRDNKNSQFISKPVRLNDYFETAKATKNKAIVTNQVIQPSAEAEREEQDRSVPEVVSNNETISNGGLFVDLAVIARNEIRRSYGCNSMKKRVRRHTVELYEDNEDEQPKKRKKDIRTKHEEEEAEKWAKDFNAMCHEVDNFPLEIE